jgi:raffinose/stachyose/melibiose transport system permease protein
MTLALPLVIFVTIWANFGYAMTIYLAGIQNIPIELYEAGYIDGTNKWSSFRYITFPLLRPAITVNFWISISGCLGMYDLTLILTNGGPANSTRTFALYFFQQVTQVATNQGQVAALSLFWFVIISTIMLTFNYFMKRKEVEI